MTSLLATARRLGPVVALAGLLACQGEGHDADHGGPPSIVLVVVDTLRADMVTGPNRIAGAPHIAALAEEGVEFTNCFSHAPMTLPSHAALFSSRAPYETGVLTNWQRVPAELPLFAEWLQTQGYGTHAVVSIETLNPRGDQIALDRGFDDYDRDYWHIDLAPNVVGRLRTTLDQIDTERPFFLFAHFSDPHDPYNDHDAEPERQAEVLIDGEHVASVSVSTMTHWEHDVELAPGRHTVEVRAERPVQVHLLDWTAEGESLGETWEVGEVRKAAKHARVAIEVEQATDSHLRMLVFEREPPLPEAGQRYIGEVEWVDRFVGELIGELRSRGLYDDVLLAFTSDHGEALGEHGEVGHVTNVFDEMLHVPLVFKLPAGSSQRAALERQRMSLVPHQDVVPTLLELAELPALPGARGASVLGPREPLLVGQTHRPVAPRTLICLRDEAYKMIHDPDADTFELYDLRVDPRELNDVLAERGAERPAWPAQLRAIAGSAQTGVMGTVEVSPQEREMLEALGYGLGD